MASDSDDLAQDIDVLAASQNLPTLTLVMDQGTVGTAAIAFLRTLGRGFTVHCGFDKFHRVHRDMTLAQSLPDDKKTSFSIANECAILVGHQLQAIRQWTVLLGEECCT